MSNSFQSILEQFQTDQSVKWKILNHVRKTRIIDTSSLLIKDNTLFHGSTPLNTPWALIAHFLPEAHFNQSGGFSSTLLDTMSHIDFFQKVKKNHRLQIIQGFTTILNSLYALYRSPTDAITWTLALGGIVTTILMITSMCDAQKTFRGLKQILHTMKPDDIQAVVEKVVADFSRIDEDDSVPAQCYHGREESLTPAEFDSFIGKYVLHQEEDPKTSFKGVGPFRGCICVSALASGEKIINFYPYDKSQSSTTAPSIGPRFTAILSLIYVLGVAGLTKAGFTNVRELLDYSRLKNEMKTSVKDAKDFIQFIAGDLCDIDLMGDKKILAEMNSQIIINSALLELRPLEYVKQQRKYFELVSAMQDTLARLQHLTSNRELIASQQSLANILSATHCQMLTLKKDVVNLKKSLDSRPDVHAIHLHGKPGVGKTSVAKFIHQQVSKRLGIDPSIYGLNFPENMHWPAYAGQENCTYDEFGARKEKDPFLTSLNQVCSTGYFSMDGADLSLKPQPCGIRNLILIGNAPRWPMQNVLKTESVIALWSRFKTYRVSFPDLIDRYDTANRRPDFSHLKFYEETYADGDNETKPTASVSVSLETIIERAVEAYKHHGRQFDEICQSDARFIEHDKNEGNDTCHLVLNLSGPTGVGKTTTYVKDICPTLSVHLSMPFRHFVSVNDMENCTYEKAIYVLDDILTHSASAETIRKYCEFYGKIPCGSLIILISNMTLHSRPTFQWSNYIIPVPVPFWKKVLPPNYTNNDACIRRLGLTGWVGTRGDPYYTGFSDTEIFFSRQRKTNVLGGAQDLGTSDTIEYIKNRYCQHLSAAREFSVMHVPQIFEPDDSYVKIVGFDLEDLKEKINRGGLSLLVHMGTKIKIPQHVFKNFSYDFPIESFAFDESDDLAQVAPRLAALFRRNCPDGELYIDCNGVQAITEGNLIKTTLAGSNRIQTTITRETIHHDPMIKIHTRDRQDGRQLYIPLYEVFAWLHGDAMVLHPYMITSTEIIALRRWCDLNPCVFRKLLRQRTWNECEVGMTSLHNQFLPSAIKFVSSLPVVELICCLAGVAFGAWAIARIVKSYMDTHKNQGKPAASIMSPPEPREDREPDPNDYLQWRHKGQDVQLSKETAHMFNVDAYDKAYNAYKRASGNQMLANPIVRDADPSDVVVKAVVNATVKCMTASNVLHGTMIYDKIGVTNAHLCGYEVVKHKVDLDTFTIDVEHKGVVYRARIMKYYPSHDIMVFQIIDKQCPTFADIRKYFFSYSDFRNAETYSAFLVKHRSNIVLEKCNVTFDRSSAAYWSSETATGVKGNGICIDFITSQNTIATSNGDCGSLYITSGTIYGRHQHARILGMHVGMRSSLYPHGTILPRELLEGKTVTDNNQSIGAHYTIELPKNVYSTTGTELYDDFVIGVLDSLQPVKNPYSGRNIQVLGMDPKQYVEPLKPARVPTGYKYLLEKHCSQDSGVQPTCTVGIQMDLSHCVKNHLDKPDILLTQFAAYDRILPSCDNEHLEWCIKNIMNRFAIIYEPLKQPITSDILFNGFPPGHSRHGTVNRIKLDSSAGLYFQRKYNITSKREFFVQDDNGNLHLANTPAAEDYFSRAKAFVRALQEGKIPQTITKTCLKSELRPTEKVLRAKIRTFDSADASLTLAHREILLGSMSSIQLPQARSEGPIQIGINALLDFSTIYKRFEKVSNSKLLQFDFTEFDRSLSLSLIEGAYRVALHVQDPRKESQSKNSIMARALAIQTTCTLRMVGNTVLRTFQGISSGFYFTSLGDSIANYIMLMYVIMKDRQKDASWFFKNIDAVILGDDISINLSPEAWTSIDLPKLVWTYKELGANVTAADKVSDIAFQNLPEFSFCSRTIRKTRKGIIVPPLKRRTILGLVEWVTPSKHHQYTESGSLFTHSTEEQIVSNVNLSLSEASLHSKNFFDSIRKIAETIQKTMVQKKIATRIVNKIECAQFHAFREMKMEEIVLGRKEVNILEETRPDLNQMAPRNENSSSPTAATSSRPAGGRNLILHTILLILVCNQNRHGLKSNSTCIETLQTSNNMSVSLVGEWCAFFKHPAPTITTHTPPSGEELSTCLVETAWGEPMQFLGKGTTKKASKSDAYHQVAKHFNVCKIDSSALSSFCNLKIKEDSLIKTTFYSHEIEKYIVEIHDNYLKVRGEGNQVSEANFIALSKLKERYDFYNGNIPRVQCAYDESADLETEVSDSIAQALLDAASDDDVPCILYNESVDLQMERAVGNSIVHAPSDAGTSITAHAPRPSPPPVDIVPHTSAPMMEQPAIITMQGGPVNVAETPNMLYPPGMMAFGGIDFDLRDVAHNQTLDHNPNLAISQGAIRGQIIAIDDYNPYNKNSKIREWGRTHDRYEGDIILRYHLIANPIFMGEIAIAWLPDVRFYRPGQILPDSLIQLYSWKTLSLREGATQNMTLYDARKNDFFRSSDIAGENARYARPGIVVVIYQPMVNPFDNQQAACYLNIGSTLGPTFKFSNPVRTGGEIAPDDDQTSGTNSLAGQTFGTIFSEVGILSAPRVFMSTDGVNYPSQASLTTTPSSRNQPEMSRPFSFSEIRQYADYLNPSGTGPAASLGGANYAAAIEMNGAVVPQFISRGFSSIKSMLLLGSYPTSTLPSHQLLQNLSGLSFANIVASFSNPTTTGADSVYVDTVVSGSYSINTGVSWFAWTPTQCLRVAWGENVLTILMSAQTVGTSNVLIRQITPMSYSIRTQVAYNYPLLNLPSGQQLLRFSLTSFPAISYVNANQPSVPFNDFEQRMYRYFNTITSTTAGFVQFNLVNRESSATVAVVRFDSAVGFTVFTDNVNSNFAQWNGVPVNNLVFENVIFGSRSSAFPLSSTTSWLQRRSPAVSATTGPFSSSVLASFIQTKTVPKEALREDRMDQALQNFSIRDQLIEYREKGVQQAAVMAGIAGASALAGLGQGISSFLTMNKQMQFQRNQQTRKFQLEGDNYERFRNVDMRIRQETAGALAPINQFNSTRNQISGVNSPRSGFKSPIRNPPGARPFVASAASQRPM